MESKENNKIPEYTLDTRIERAIPVWEKLGMSEEDVIRTKTGIGNIEFYFHKFTDPRMTHIDPKQLREAIMEEKEELVEIEKKYGLSDYDKNLGKAKQLSLKNGIQAMYDSLNAGKPVGLIGKPGCGKSTLLEIIKETDDEIITIDEFWKEGSPNFEEKKDEFEYLVDVNEKVIVAGAQLDDNQHIKTVAYLHLDERSRKSNIRLRQNYTDKNDDGARLDYFEAFSIIDNFLYGLQKIKANIIIDSSSIRY